MPLQNRVDPYGRLVATPERGAWLGNRGVLHDDARRIVAAFRLRRWICCALWFKGRHRAVFTPRRWTELFFLDEATAFAAGHRPCAECRRARFEEFRAVWAAANPRLASSPKPDVDTIDRALHSERIARGGGKRTWPSTLAALPPGAMFEHGGRAHLWWAERVRPWSFGGYGAAIALGSDTRVDVLTPRSIVRAFRAGLVPQVHESAR